MLRVGICEQCGFDWDTPADDLVDRIGQIGPGYRRRLQRLVREVGASGLRVRPADGVWSPLEYAAHMRDVAEFYLDRIQQIIAEDKPRLTAVPGGFGALAETRRYNDENVEDVLDALDRSAGAASARLSTLTPTGWARVGIGSEGDQRDLVVLARRLAHEGHHHLLDLTTGHSDVP